MHLVLNLKQITGLISEFYLWCKFSKHHTGIQVVEYRDEINHTFFFPPVS